MNADRWKVVKGLFQRTIKLPADEWFAYLERVSAGDQELRTEVASLLAEHEPGESPHLTALSSQEVTLRLPANRCSDDVDEPEAPKEPTDV